MESGLLSALSSLGLAKREIGTLDQRGESVSRAKVGKSEAHRGPVVAIREAVLDGLEDSTGLAQLGLGEGADVLTYPHHRVVGAKAGADRRRKTLDQRISRCVIVTCLFAIGGPLMSPTD